MVEAAFNHLTQILSGRRLSLHPSLVEQLLILALDAQGWEDYDYTAVCEMVWKNARCAKFRLARSDKGVTRNKRKKKKSKKGNKKKAKNSGEGKAVVQSDSDTLGFSSSSSSSSDSSDSDAK